MPSAECRVPSKGSRRSSRATASRCLRSAPGTRHSARRAKRGFTLIELLVVLIGLVVVAAAVVPSITAAGRQGDLDRIAARVAASARFARETAIELQTPVTMTVETAPDAVRLFREEDADLSPRGEEPLAAPELAPLPGRYAFVPLPSRITAHLEPVPEGVAAMAGARGARDAAGTLRFPADGRPAGGWVRLQDERGREYRVVVTPDTGVVRIERGDG